jgi:hypothetical protein
MDDLLERQILGRGVDRDWWSSIGAIEQIVAAASLSGAGWFSSMRKDAMT